MTNADRLSLTASDCEDLTIFASVFQDSAVRMADLTYLPRERLFAAVLSRFRWEGNGRAGATERFRTGVNFKSVLAVKSRNLETGSPDLVLNLLTINCQPGEDGAANIEWIFAGGASIQLQVECIDAELADLAGPWKAATRPNHPIAAEE
jgi:hypothetical protein